MNFKQRKEYAFSEYLKGRTLTEIAKDKDSLGNPLMSYSWLQKTSKKENWANQRREYIENKKEEIKEELLAEELSFSKNFLKKANSIIDLSLDSINKSGFKDEKALVQFLRFIEDYKDKIKEIEPTINIKQEVISDKEQVEMLKKLSDVIENDINNKADSFVENLNDD